ncbi:D-2-hydroxyacid dehydrogenase [Lysinibacillus macroides]|uniref:Glycerate dehydrogenase n=1 Tax=Lysinibacillus macroides TaxID=33935 RepID=A0A0N0UXB5_9BACI|nr:D-2-hydroxyacid dehydrogenase [Lysinibacillus macroides]KOY83734.1 glycerate dehydrogenase [Lysinibacillus macroides]QPR66995.1 D-2-hydroxyacid dehydrogenase [Lysinibacillus macroides]
MNIVILDGYTLNPGDLSWRKLSEVGEVTVYNRTPNNLIVERAVEAEIILTNKTPLPKEILAQLPKLKYIGVLATGYDVVDVEAAKEQNVVVTNIPAYGTHSVAQMVFALLLEHCQRVQRHSDAVRAGEWTNHQDWCFWNYPLIELAGKKFGIVGFGRIGYQTAQVASALGMSIIAYNRQQREVDLPNFQWADHLTDLLKEADVISLHCPLTPETEEIINRDNLAIMKASAIIINTSRGRLINNQDLADALNNGVIAGAGLDVLDVEPPSASNPLLSAKNCMITPHISWATKEARGRLLDMAVDNVKAFVAGAARNIV